MRSVINISTDQIMIWHAGRKVSLDRNGVDTAIGKVLVELDREQSLEQCLVINGPGGFTNLRVGSLALNLLKTLKGNQISFFSLSKIEFFDIAYQAGFLPRYGVVYIGQKTNVWLRDFEQKALVKQMKKAELAEMNLDQVFVDFVNDEGYFEIGDQLFYTFGDAGAELILGGKKLEFGREQLLINSCEKIEANYMIDPNVS